MVLFIIGAIAGLVGLEKLNRQKEMKIRAAKNQLTAFRDAIELYKIENGNYPATEEGLNWLLPGHGTCFDGGGRPAPIPILKDPWGNQYKYANPGGHNPQIWSNGPSGRPGAEDNIYP